MTCPLDAPDDTARLRERLAHEDLCRLALGHPGGYPDGDLLALIDLANPRALAAPAAPFRPFRRLSRGIAAILTPRPARRRIGAGGPSEGSGGDDPRDWHHPVRGVSA